MADTVIEAISGTEIINDLLDQIKRKLQSSCDLRDMDSYGQGYSATVKIDLKLYGMDTTTFEGTIDIIPKAEPPAESTPVELGMTVDVEQELDLEALRERSNAPLPEPPQAEEESRMPARLRRKYTRRTGVETTPSGGAVDFEDTPEGA